MNAAVERYDIAVIGAGAAGLLAAIAARGAIADDGESLDAPAGAPSVALFDSMPQPGKKILISGGGKCNLTNERVTEHDFAPVGSKIVRSILREFPPASIVRFVEDAGVPTRIEPTGKIFPAEGRRARDVLEALQSTAKRAGVVFHFGRPIDHVERSDHGFHLGLADTTTPAAHATCIVIATGGRSIPKTGSTGAGYIFAEKFGHTIVTPKPALVALTSSHPAGLAGLTIPALLQVRGTTGKELARSAGSLLFTHQGISGPAGLDASLWRATASHPDAEVVADFWTLADPVGPWSAFRDLPKPPGACLAAPPAATDPSIVDTFLREQIAAHPKRRLAGALAERLPRSLVDALIENGDTPLAELRQEARRRAAAAVTRFDLGIRGDAGFERAEVTSGGVPLSELARRTLESRIAPGLYFCGEVVDVTGRLGGFNFQWAWSSGFVAGRGAARAIDTLPHTRGDLA